MVSGCYTGFEGFFANLVFEPSIDSRFFFRPILALACTCFGKIGLFLDLSKHRLLFSRRAETLAILVVLVVRAVNMRARADERGLAARYKGPLVWRIDRSGVRFSHE